MLNSSLVITTLPFFISGVYKLRKMSSYQLEEAVGIPEMIIL